MTAPRELAIVHPLGTAPVISDGDITVAESGAIVGESALSQSRFVGHISYSTNHPRTAYVIAKYGDGKFNAPESGYVDDLFCTSNSLRITLRTEVIHLLVDTHYAEGTLMPLLVNKLIFSLVPARAPFILRPILRAAFSKLEDAMLDPRLKKQAALVRYKSYLL